MDDQALTLNQAGTDIPQDNAPNVPLFVPVIAEPDIFPQPTIFKSSLVKIPVRISESIVETKIAIFSKSGNFYEVGGSLKNAIFGRVAYGVQLVRHEDFPGEFRRTENHLAIKVYSKRKLRELQGRIEENALMEINALQYLGNQHPNLMGQIECCADEENIYSIMNYCPGGELFDYIDSNGPLSNDQAKIMFRQLLSGLQRLQELGVGHRDLSLENILFDGQSLYVIIDFGMCLKLRANPHSPGQYCCVPRQRICGKKNYIAPEVLRQDEFFNPMLVDIWAAGIILFMTLTGAPPVDQATDSDERFQMVAAGRLHEMVTAWELDMDPHVVDLIQRLLNIDPWQRPSIQQILQHEWLRDAN